MKKLVLILIVVLTAASILSCGTNTVTTTENNATATEAETEAQETKLPGYYYSCNNVNYSRSYVKGYSLKTDVISAPSKSLDNNLRQSVLYVNKEFSQIKYTDTTNTIYMGTLTFNSKDEIDGGVTRERYNIKWDKCPEINGDTAFSSSILGYDYTKFGTDAFFLLFNFPDEIGNDEGFKQFKLEYQLIEEVK